MWFSIFVDRALYKMNYKYPQHEKLKSKKRIEQLFAEGKALTVFPLRLIYLKTTHQDNTGNKTGVSVSKRLHKKAVTRNRIKRQLREAYRLNKPKYFNKSSTSWLFMILYIGKDKPTSELLNIKMQELFQKFIIKKDEKTIK